MSEHRSSIIPRLRYRDARAMTDWLCDAFGSGRHAMYADGAVVHHAQLVYGSGMVMLSSVRDAEPGAWSVSQPDECGGRETQAPCVIVTDPDAHYARAKAAGAQLLIDIADQDYGGRGYECRDPEGHVWWFGSYDPWRDGAA